MAQFVQLCTRGRPLEVALAETRAIRKSIDNGMLPATHFYQPTFKSSTSSPGSVAGHRGSHGV